MERQTGNGHSMTTNEEIAMTKKTKDLSTVKKRGLNASRQIDIDLELVTAGWACVGRRGSESVE